MIALYEPLGQGSFSMLGESTISVSRFVLDNFQLMLTNDVRYSSVALFASLVNIDPWCGKSIRRVGTGGLTCVQVPKSSGCCTHSFLGERRSLAQR